MDHALSAFVHLLRIIVPIWVSPNRPDSHEPTGHVLQRNLTPECSQLTLQRECVQESRTDACILFFCNMIDALIMAGGPTGGLWFQLPNYTVLHLL